MVLLFIFLTLAVKPLLGQITADGGALWTEKFGVQRHQFLVKGEYGYGGSIVLAGSFHGTIDFGSGLLVASGDDGISEGAEDIFLAILEVSR